MKGRFFRAYGCTEGLRLNRHTGPPKPPAGAPRALSARTTASSPWSVRVPATSGLSPLKVDGLITRKRQGYRRQERPVDRPEPRAGHLSAQDSQLVAQNSDLDIL